MFLGQFPIFDPDSIYSRMTIVENTQLQLLACQDAPRGVACTIVRSWPVIAVPFGPPGQSIGDAVQGPQTHTHTGTLSHMYITHIVYHRIPMYTLRCEVNG